jgi:choline-sulfatase
MHTRPNILFIFSDQHNARVLGSAGDPIARTPNLDRLATESVVFDRAYCQNPLCVPSRTTLMTGQYCRTHGLYENPDIMEPNSPTFPRTLSAAGYRTCLIGKSHFNGEQFHGYQQRPYGDLYGQGHQPDPCRPPNEPPNGSGLGGMVENAGPSGIPLPLTQTEICVAETAKWLQAHCELHADQPFCLSLHFDKPHFPVRCPAKYFEHYDGRVGPPAVPEGYAEQAVPFVQRAIRCFGGKSEEVAARCIAAYYGCVEWVDDAVGRVLETLAYLGLDENTVVVYSSDHGDLLGDKGAWNKTLFFDSSTRIPLMVRWPGRFAPRTANDLVGLVDLYPTLCDLAGVEIPQQCEGKSLLPVLEGGALGRERIFCESAFLGFAEAAGCMVRQGDWKFSLYLDGSRELYNLADDPDEWDNRSGDRACAEIETELCQQVVEFWHPEEQNERVRRTPKVKRQKHCFAYSNQFMSGDGIVFSGRP